MVAKKVRIFEEDELESHVLHGGDAKTEGTGTLTYDDDWRARAYDEAVSKPLDTPWPLDRLMRRS